MKKLLCLFLTLCMVLGGLVITTSAEGEVEDPAPNQSQESSPIVGDDPSSGAESGGDVDTTVPGDDTSVESLPSVS